MPIPFLVSLLINVVIGVGLSYVSNKLQKKQAEKAKKKAGKLQQEDTGGSILEVQYGESQPRLVAIGKVATAGVAVYDNSFGTANKTLQRVYKLSDFYTTALTRVAINNEWVTLGSLDATKGYPISSGDYSGLIWVKFLDGRQTTADSYLTGNDNPDGRWTTDHKGIGVSYAIVTLEYDDEKLNSIPEILFEFTGAPLYDPRKDTSVGGSGSHRWNDVTTWEYSANPILAEYNYRMGFYTGTYGSGHDRFCGMGYSQAELDYTRYDAAADICDETVEGENRYVVSIFLDATREHGDNIEDLMLSCAGMIVEGVSGPYPILGASQTPVATLTNDDLIADAPVVFAPKRPVSEIVNTVSGNYIEPSLVYAETGYAQQTLAGTVTADRRTIDFNLNFPMVPSKRQAEQLASIYFSENRYEATKTVLVHMKWLKLEVGDWITWTDDEDGAASRDYQIVGMGIAELTSDQPRAVQLTLQERDDSIYDGIGPVAAPTPAGKPGAPTYLQELQSFSVAPIMVEGSGGHDVPAIVVTWAAVTDPTVESILIEWRPAPGTPPVPDDTRRVAKVMSRNATVAILQEGVVGSTLYEVRNTIIPRPARTTTPSTWAEVTTDPPGTVGLGMLDEATIGTLENYRNDLDTIFSTANRTAIGTTESIIAKAQEVLGRRGIKAQVGDVIARVAREETARADDKKATALVLESLDGRVDGNTGSITDILNLEIDEDSALFTKLLLIEGDIDNIDNPTSGLIKQSQDLILGDEYFGALALDISNLETRVGNIDDPDPLIGSVASLSKAFTDYQTAQAIVQDAVSARANQGSAQGLMKIEAITAPSGVAARFGVYLRTSTTNGFPAANYPNAAEFLEIVGTGANAVSRKVIKATQTVFSDPSGNNYAMFDSSGAYFNNARIRNLTADNIVTNGLDAKVITTGTLKAEKIEASGITQLYSNTFSAPAGPGTGSLGASGEIFVQVPATVNFSVTLPSKVIIFATFTGAATSNTTVRLQLANNSALIGPQSRMIGSALIGNSFQQLLNSQTMIFSENINPGSHGYKVFFTTNNGTAYCQALTIQALVITR
jgi:hypothetical protein